MDKVTRSADDDDMATGHTSITGLAMAAAVVLMVGGIVAAVAWFAPSQTANVDPAQPAPGPAVVGAGKDYYLFVRLLEFKPRMPDGARWDTGDDSAPDALVKLYWQGQRVFTLPKREDQLIAAWDIFRVDVKDLVLTGGEVDASTLVNAPIVRVADGLAVTIKVWDDDPMFSDEALDLEIPLTQLHEGANDIALPRDSGLSRLRIDMIDRTTPLPKLIELESNRD